MIAEGVGDRHKNNGAGKRFQRIFGAVVKIDRPCRASATTTPTGCDHGGDATELAAGALPGIVER